MRTAGDKDARSVKVTTHLSLVSKECSCDATNPFGFKVVHMESVGFTLAGRSTNHIQQQQSS